ncbi:TrkH family potassium uptake protein [Aquisalimonas lutea]|uniref:TrkH family potassium uptake protein n=1 Tax=Aquisalimonas lutea TaxID=1327750 RepID=UPI0025B59E5B|nr:TrkH family potassium uptake protein [Aquisalimonas lutea]MDN3519546.1 TrkH family potassium uptake protein [Aquisalimonas lutea]
MHWFAVQRIVGILVALFSVTFLPSVAVSLLYHDGQAVYFLLSASIVLIAGLALSLPVWSHRQEVAVRDGFLIVALFWTILGVAGALPLILSIHLSFTDAVFEAISGFTTTGATVVLNLDSLPASILYHRQQLQWLGGMGVIVLAVAILPMLGVGGMQLYRAEMSGLSQGEKLTPRIQDTARALWAIYVSLTLACAALYWLAGMSVFDAVGHAYTTIATGGFSTHDASFAHFDSTLIESIAVVFMMLGAVNFSLHFLAWRRGSTRGYLQDPELRVFLVITLTATALIALPLAMTHTYAGPIESLRYALFQTVSVITTTGYGTATFAEWPLFVPLLLATLAFIGGSVASTSGGMKVIRIMLLFLQGSREAFTLIHPRAVSNIKVGGRVVPDEVIRSVWGFYSLFVLTALLLTGSMMALGLNLETAFGATVASLTLLGPGLGEVATSFATVGDSVKWLAIFGMLVGRLEVFTLLVLFTPAFWRR